MESEVRGKQRSPMNFNHSAQTSVTKELAGKKIERKWKQITASYCK